MPLLWLSLLVYVAGLAHYASENAPALRDLLAEVTAVGADPGRAWAVLAAGEEGFPFVAEFVAGFDPGVGGLDPIQWYGVSGAVVGSAVLVVVAARLAWRDDHWGPITMDETIVLALAMGLSTGVLGGPLLAGSVLMPFLFGVIVHHTRRRPGWTPSYLYLVPVLGPAAGLALGYAGLATVPIEAVAFVLLPIFGGLFLPLRAAVRRRFGR